MKQTAKAITVTGLAGAAAFAGATQSYGTIVNVTAPTDIAGNAPNDAGTTREFYDVDTGTTTSTRTETGDYIEFAYNNSSTYNQSFTGLYDFGGKPVAYYASNGSNYPYPLAKGTVIGTGGPYGFSQTAGKLSLLAFSYNGTFYAFNAQNTPEYVGFQFTSTTDGLVHDGWIELESVSNDGTDLDGGLKFLGVAYNSVPDADGGTIEAGQTVAAVPEPGTLSALALGAAGLVGVGLQRRRRQAALAAAQN